jgi:hypothetical protein
LKLKERENEQATHIEDTERLASEIEMLKFVLFLVCRKKQQQQHKLGYSHRREGALLL